MLNSRSKMQTAVFFIPLVVLVGLFGIGTLQIVSRFFFSFPFTWGEEAMRLFFVFLVFFGAVAVTWNREHLVVDVIHIFLQRRMSPRLWTRYQKVVLGLQAAFCGLCSFGCFQMAAVRWGTTSQTIPFWRVGYMYALAGAALAGCAVISLIHAFMVKRKE